MVPLMSGCSESKVRYPVPWGGKGGGSSLALRYRYLSFYLVAPLLICS
ncbi:MAG: hypothetical protein JG773_606 [Spirochaeta sp.]|jgi:hypothetical protein|nr:hypothetical protein [Spirochaeta sp.]